jgi:hypothetical protein
VSRRILPVHLHSAWSWIDSAGEWDEAASDPGYAVAAFANAVEHDVTDVTLSDLEDVLEWYRLGLGASRTDGVQS